MGPSENSVYPVYPPKGICTSYFLIGKISVVDLEVAHFPRPAGGRGFIKAGGKGRLFVKCETSSQGDSGCLALGLELQRFGL